MEQPNERFRYWRLKAGIRRAEVAEMFRTSGRDIGSSYQAIKNIEDGNTAIKSEHLQILSEQYQVNPNWILSGEGNMFLTTNVSEPKGFYIPGKKSLSQLLEEISDSIAPEKKELADRLKEEIHKLVERNDELQDLLIAREKRAHELAELLDQLKKLSKKLN